MDAPRPRTPLQRKTSQINGAKSNGPKTSDGKFNSSKNALDHGLTAQIHSLPGEDPQEREERATRLIEDLNPQTPIQHELCDGLLHIADRRHRNHEALHGTLETQVQTAPQRFDLELEAKFEEGK